MNVKGKFKLSRFFMYLILVLASAFSLFPFVWMIIGATNGATDIILGKMTFGDQFITNMTSLFKNTDSPMGTILLNSLKISGINTILVLLFCGMAAYGFQFFDSKGKRRIYSILITTMMIPFATLMIPLFKMFAGMLGVNLLNTHFAVIIVTAANVFMIFFFRQSFMNYPTEVLQAARVDGASEFSIFFRVFMPSMRSTYAAAAIYAFMTSWNTYLWPLVVIQSNNKKTTTLLISSMSSSYTPDYGAIMCAIVLSTLPILILFFAFQRQFVEGMTGSVKQ